MHGHVLEVAAALSGVLVIALVIAGLGALVRRWRHRAGSAWDVSDGPYSFEVLMSPALWEALPPPPISPAAGMLISTAPRVPGAQREHPALAPPGESLFIPAPPVMPVLPAPPSPVPVAARAPIDPAPITGPAPIIAQITAQITATAPITAPAPITDPAPITAPIPVVQSEAAPSPLSEVPAPRPISPPYRLRNLRGEY